MGLRELKPATIFFQLATRSTKLSRGIVEDLLIKVSKFIFPIDFVVLETEGMTNPKNKIPVTLGLSFLATLNTLTNCMGDKMKLTFGNTTIKLNVFNLQKQPMGFNDVDHHTLNWVGDSRWG